MRTKIYLASRYSRRVELCGYAVELLGLGFEITSRWLKGEHELDDKGRSVEADDAERARFAFEDWHDLIAADICISFTQPPRTDGGRGGRHVEFGGAVASGLRCIVVGHRENVFHHLPSVEFYPTWDECFTALAAQASGKGDDEQ